jgi:DNA-binding NarL/FixJ family response regulator
MNMNKIRVVLADDQVLFVENLKFVLEKRAKDIAVTGVAQNGSEAIACVERQKPHIVLMDIRMPIMDGVEATRIIHQRFPDTQIIVLTTFDDDAYVHDALHYGAVGYLLKNIPPKELIASIRAVREGGVLISPQIARKLVDQVFQLTREKNKKAELSKESFNQQGLSNREKEILHLISKGYNNKEISNFLFIAEQTVKNYAHSIYSKIGARDRAQAIKMALDGEIQAQLKSDSTKLP